MANFLMCFFFRTNWQILINIRTKRSKQFEPIAEMIQNVYFFISVFARQGQLIFEDGQKELELDFTVLPDNTPERDETFAVRIYNASGKAIVNTQKQELTINILSNDDAHGRIGFAPSSLTKVNAELAADSTVTFEVIREYGSLGRVVVLWNVSGNISNGDISPMFGVLVFDNGETTQNISLTVHRDMIPELLEVAYVRFVNLDVNSK